MQKGHILKFVVTGRTFNPNTGVRTFPRQIYGLSQDAPQQFKNNFSLKAEHGYIYKHQNISEFEYPSQQHYFDIHNSKESGTQGHQQARLGSNPLAFHRKKGRLTQFMDKNGWMAPVVPIMGFQKTPQARLLQKRDREQRIRSLNVKPVYENKKALKPKVNPQYYQTISTIMSQKLRIRKKRASLKDQQQTTVPATARTMTPAANHFHVQHVSQQMAKSNMDFYSTNSTFYQGNQFSRRGVADTHNQISISPRKASPQKMSLAKRFSSICTSRVPAYNRKKEMDDITMDAFGNDKPVMEEWYRTSCHSKWAYKSKPLDTQGDLQ